MKYNWHTINYTNLKCTIWRVLTYVHTQHEIITIKIGNITISPQISSWTFVILSPNPSCLSHPQAATGPLSVPTDQFPFPRTSHLTVCTLLRLGSSTQHKPMLSVSAAHSFLLLSSIQLYGCTTSAYPFTCSWMFLLFPVFGNRK